MKQFNLYNKYNLAYEFSGGLFACSLNGQQGQRLLKVTEYDLKKGFIFKLQKRQLVTMPAGRGEKVTAFEKFLDKVAANPKNSSFDCIVLHLFEAITNQEAA